MHNKPVRLDKNGNKIGNRINCSRPRKLTNQQALRMYRDYQGGTLYKNLLERYGICEASFFNYMNRIKQGIIKPS